MNKSVDIRRNRGAEMLKEKIDWYQRNVYDAYYLAFGLMGSREAALMAVEDSFRELLGRVGGMPAEEQDNQLLIRVIEICKAHPAEVPTFVGAADYLALMAMPVRYRVLLLLADMLNLPDATIAKIMGSRRDRVARSVKEARSKLLAACSDSLNGQESVETIMYRAVPQLMPSTVALIWERLGYRPHQVKDWSPGRMVKATVKTWPILVGVIASTLCLMTLIFLLILTRSTQQNPDSVLEAITVPAALTQPARTPSPLTTTTAAEQQLSGPESQVVITLTGDTVLGNKPNRDSASDSFVRRMGYRDEDWPFQLLAPFFKADDLTITNLLCALTRESSHPGVETALRGRPAYAKYLQFGSVELACLENTHTHDFGDDGYKDTKEALGEYKIAWCDAANSYTFTSETGVKVGVGNLMDPIDETTLANTIQSLKNDGCQVVIMSLHWGEELEEEPSNAQVELAHKAIDLGADAIMGHHAHIVQRMENYHDRPIFYCLGNLVYGGATNPTNWDIAMAHLTFTLQEGQVTNVDTIAIPGSVSSDIQTHNYQAMPYKPSSVGAVRIYEALGLTKRNLLDYDALYEQIMNEK